MSAPSARLADDEAHEGKERHGGKGVFHHAVAHGDLQQVHRQGEVVAHQPDRDEADDAKGNGDVEPKIDKDDDGEDRIEADFDGAHAVSSWPGVCVASSGEAPTTFSAKIRAASTALAKIRQLDRPPRCGEHAGNAEKVAPSPTS